MENRNKGLLLCVEALKKNTDRASRTLFNASKLEVMVAMTRLSQEGNESYLKVYTDWVENVEENLLSSNLPEKVGNLADRPIKYVKNTKRELIQKKIDESKEL